MTRERAFVKRQRDVNAFAELSHGNAVILENAQKKRDGYFYEAMASVVLSAFKFEAFLNHLGPRVFSFWADVERLPHANKLEILATELNVTIDRSRRPFQTLTELFRARDGVAHGKPEFLETKTEETATREELRRRKPLTNWEAVCTIEFAERAHGDTEEIARMLWIAAGFDEMELHQSGHSYSISNVQ
ncbi:hypothetical protein FYK55_17030 [Roseiconus nitratireducens]|uniref:RiboL-PSP-HEPN domain-containing protein n=1 Tax=Roseiconus nitratireducens TaxID=2605748 RepID=A0A5M6D5P9_9BACT|nr:hypothetical protein [Roseiconus nitratireducens]KAA5541900.1 hypothetical protein FYK55_17030 [Roseiconus nitratireducens]